MCKHAIFPEDSIQSLGVLLPTESFIKQSQAIDGQLEVVALKGVSGELIVSLEMRLHDGVLTARHEGLCCGPEHAQIV